MSIRENLKENHEKKRQERLDKDYNEFHPQIEKEVDGMFIELTADPDAFVATRIGNIDKQIKELDDKGDDLSENDKRDHAFLTAAKASIEAQPSNQDMVEQIANVDVLGSRVDYAGQIAARMDKTITRKEGSTSELDKAHVQHMVAVAFMLRINTEKLSLTDPLDIKEAKLKMLLGDPAKTDKDDLSQEAIGLKGFLELEVAEQRKQRSSLYKNELDSTTGEVTAERIDDKGLTKEYLGRMYHKWGKEGWKGKMKKTLVAVGFGAALTLTAGAAGAGVAVLGGAAAAMRVIKYAGTTTVEKAGDISAADQDARERINDMRDQRVDLFNNLPTNHADIQEDRTLWDARVRANEKNKGNRRTAALGVVAIAAGSGIAAGVAGAIDQGFNTAVGYAGQTGEHLWHEGAHALGFGNAHEHVGANAGDTQPIAPTGPGNPSGQEGFPPYKKGPGSLASKPVSDFPPKPGMGTGTKDVLPSASHTVEIKTGNLNHEYVSQAYADNHLPQTEMIRDAAAAARDHQLTTVYQPDGTFFYKLTPNAMHDLGLTGDPTDTDKVMRVLANHSRGKFDLAA